MPGACLNVAHLSTFFVTSSRKYKTPYIICDPHSGQHSLFGLEMNIMHSVSRDDNHDVHSLSHDDNHVCHNYDS